MTLPIRYALLAVVVAGCEATGAGESSGGTGVRVAESGTKRGSAGGFSATLAQELGAPEGSLGAAAPGAATGSADSATGSATAAGGSAAAGSAGSPGAGSAVASAAGSAGSPAGAGSAAAGSAAPASAGSATAAAPASADESTPDEKGAPASADEVASAPVAPPASVKGRVYVKPPAALAAIKLDLEPNWERDVGEAGTFSLVLKVPNTSETRVFSVRYGYEDDAAPVDCDQYRKFLADKKVMEPTLNRQRSGACYVEGKNAYRYLVSYGGKRLLCEGSLYKDAASASLGDLRDKVLMQAKKICETLAL